MLKNEKKKNRYRAGAVSSIYPLAILQSGESGGPAVSPISIQGEDRRGDDLTVRRR